MELDKTVVNLRIRFRRCRIGLTVLFIAVEKKTYIDLIFPSLEVVLSSLFMFLVSNSNII